MEKKITEVVVVHSGDVVQKFNSMNTVGDVLDYLNKVYDEKTIKDISLDLVVGKEQIKESIQTVVPNREYVIWSSTDLAEADEQIPLITIKFDEDGELEDVIAPSDDAFDEESKKITVNSLKATEGRPIKDRLVRVDKSLNHNDQFMSTELQRLYITANKGIKKAPIPKGYADDSQPVNGATNEQGIQMLANQILLTSRDDLKAAANYKSTTEDTLATMFADITGVDYYTEKIVDNAQYDYLLTLLGRSDDKYKESHVAPEDNDYVKYLKDLTEDLIEKVNLKRDSKFYDFNLKDIEKARKDKVAEISEIIIELSEDPEATEDDIIDKFAELTGVDYYTNSIKIADVYSKLLDELQLDENTQPKDNTYISDIENTVEDAIEVVLLRADPNFYNN